MSASGHELPRRLPGRMAERPPIPDANVVSRRGGEGPNNDICTAVETALFDQLVGGGKTARRNRQSNRLGGLEVDDEFKFCGSQYGKVT